MHSTLNKIFPWFFGVMFILIICVWTTIGYFLVIGVSAVSEKGLKGVAEQVWCGNDAACKQPVIVAK
jgi:hypothetical protein